MTEVKEGVAILSVEDPDHDSKTCCFCQKGDPIERKNVFDANPDEDDRAHLNPLDWVSFKNDAHTLGVNIGKDRLPSEGFWVFPSTENTDSTYKAIKATVPGASAIGVAAHHLIPGNAALAKSRLYLEGTLGSTGSKTTNIGYDINKAANGIWAPGNYAMRPWGSGGDNFKGNADRYAEAAILTVEVQFHDAHPVYSEHVLKALEEIADKVVQKEQICPFAADQDPATQALITLVARLDFLSERCRRMVTFPSSRWKKDMFLSRYSFDFINNRRLGD